MEVLRKIDDPYPYFRGLIADIGFPACKIPYQQPLRMRGITKNNFYTLYDLAMLGITNHSKVPLRLATVAGKQLRNGEIACTGQGFQQLSPVLVLGPQQRTAVQVEQVECPVLDAGGAVAVLHLVEAGHTGLVESDDLAIENRMMVGETVCQCT